MESILADANRIAEHLRLLDSEGTGRITMLLTGLFSEIEALQEEMVQPKNEINVFAAAQIGDQLIRAYWNVGKIEDGLNELAKVRRELALTVWIHRS
jgi:hypothetical protein